MNQALDVNVDGLLDTLEHRGIPLPYEIGTFVALQACERVLEAPVDVGGDVVWIRDDGAVHVAAATTASDEDAARSVVKMLGDLLVKSAPGVPPMILDLIESGPSDGSWGLSRLRDDLEAALVPLNRGATTRVLGRLIRESQRNPSPVAQELGVEEEAHLSSELDRLLGTNVGTTGPAAARDDSAEPPDLQGMIYSQPPPASARSAKPALRLRDDIDQLRETRRGGGWAIWIAALSLCATCALLWFVTQQ